MRLAPGQIHSDGLTRITGTILILASAARDHLDRARQAEDVVRIRELMAQMDVFLAQLIASAKTAATLAEEAGNPPRS